jgi:hypothetical protein
MDHMSLLNALTTALETAPQADHAMGDDGFFWPLSQASSNPSQADPNLVRLLEQLRKTPELEAFKDGMQVVANTAHAVSYLSLARWLLVRAAQVGAEKTLENLRRFLAASELPFRMILALGGITLDSSCTLGQTITLLPWEELPESPGKRSACAVLLRWGLFMHRPTAALVRDIALPQQIFTQAEWQQGKHNPPPLDNTALQDALLCIGLVGPVAPYELVTWLEPPEWAPILGNALSAPLHDGSISRSQWPSGAAMQARELCERFSQLSPSHKALMRLRMQRLNSAMRRLNPVDAAIDLGITLESLFLDEDARDELSFQLRLRAARVLGQDDEDRARVFTLVKELYGVRSAAVHRGRIPTTKRFRTGTIEDLLKAGFDLAAQAITTFLQKGEPQKDDWTKIILA